MGPTRYRFVGGPLHNQIISLPLNRRGQAPQYWHLPVLNDPTPVTSIDLSLDSKPMYDVLVYRRTHLTLRGVGFTEYHLEGYEQSLIGTHAWSMP